MRALYGAVVACLCVATTVSGQSVHLSLSEALGRARDHSPAVLIALARIDESRARQVGARLRFRENPSLDIAIGPRRTDAGTRADLDVGFSQRFETGGQRAARIAGAEATIDHSVAAVESARRNVLTSVATLVYRVAHAQSRSTLLQSVEQAAADAARIATIRYDAGDIAVLDVNLGRSALARARSARASQDADRTLLVAELGRLVGVAAGTDIVVTDRLSEVHPAELDRLLESVETRADLRALTASLAEADADVRLGAAARRPDLSVGGRVKQEGGEHAVIGSLTIALPMFDSGQELRAAGSARGARIRQELAFARAAAINDVRALHEAYAIRRIAAETLEQDAMPTAIESEQLAQRSFEEGQLSLADLLVIRRELVETRLEYLDRLLDAAETAVARDAAAGVLQ
jgi:cobalt-zinc-cadmium efflux system outer membrane protein